MRVLALETSTTTAAAAVMSDEKLEAEICMDNRLQHSVVLFPMIEKLLSMLSIDIKDIDAVAVSGGPGSFTGLRIGVAAAKGIAQGGNKKFIAVSSLDAIAYQHIDFDGIICPVLDALRDNVYTAVYTAKDGELAVEMDYTALHIDELIEKLKEDGRKVMFCGDCLDLHRDRLMASLGEKYCESSLISRMPRAGSIAELGLRRLSKGQEDDIYTYAPIYLRKSQAEREYERKTGEKLDL